VMDVLDQEGCQGWNLVFDNAPIHMNSAIDEEIQQRGYRCQRLPPWSPFLNPIEEFFSKLKLMVRREPLDQREYLPERIAEGARHITLQDIHATENPVQYGGTDERVTAIMGERVTAIMGERTLNS
ncbi:hypothetical protein EC973_003066, partial [Apophysomyces ossiformis]